ncbi:MAG: hypothetical protein IPF68_16420 [Bacteroidales bacterium]|nr:hypothetical protein [Bacteroidales bacterium]
MSGDYAHTSDKPSISGISITIRINRYFFRLCTPRAFQTIDSSIHFAVPPFRKFPGIHLVDLVVLNQQKYAARRVRNFPSRGRPVLPVLMGFNLLAWLMAKENTEPSPDSHHTVYHCQIILDKFAGNSYRPGVAPPYFP